MEMVQWGKCKHEDHKDWHSEIQHQHRYSGLGVENKTMLEEDFQLQLGVPHACAHVPTHTNTYAHTHANMYTHTHTLHRDTEKLRQGPHILIK